MTRTVTPLDLQVVSDRMKGNGAWNGQGLLVHLALTSDADSSRKWMEPLLDLCMKIQTWQRQAHDGLLTEEEAATLDGLAEYARAFAAALADG